MLTAELGFMEGVKKAAQFVVWASEVGSGSNSEKIALSITSLLYPEQPT